jgi:hypothetical protein
VKSSGTTSARNHRPEAYVSLVVSLLLATASISFAGDKMSDAAIKQKLLGYWHSPRHGYHVANDGIIYMCPRAYCTTTNRWNVKNGVFYWDAEPHKIVSLTAKKFVYRQMSPGGVSFTLVKGTKEDVDPEEESINQH